MSPTRQLKRTSSALPTRALTAVPHSTPVAIARFVFMDGSSTGISGDSLEHDLKSCAADGHPPKGGPRLCQPLTTAMNSVGAPDTENELEGTTRVNSTLEQARAEYQMPLPHPFAENATGQRTHENNRSSYNTSSNHRGDIVSPNHNVSSLGPSVGPDGTFGMFEPITHDSPHHRSVSTSPSDNRGSHLGVSEMTTQDSTDIVARSQDGGSPMVPVEARSDTMCSGHSGVPDHWFHIEKRRSWIKRWICRRGHIHRKYKHIRRHKGDIKRWFYIVSPDLVLALLLLAATWAINEYAPPYRWKQRTFPMTWDPNSQTWSGPVELSYPYNEFVISILVVELVISIPPVLVILAMQIWLRHLWDLTSALSGFFMGFALVTFLQIILKWFIGELRPYFITACNPRLAQPLGPPFLRYLKAEICTRPGKELNFAMQSFPSGHTAEAFFAAIYLALYLSAKLKAFSDYHTSFWKIVVILSPVLGAALIAASVTIEHNHHFHDVWLSIPIGVLVALLAYRTHYASLFDYRTNHLCLPWTNTHKSINLTSPSLPVRGQDKEDFRFSEKNRHQTAVAWPRRPENSTGNGEQATGIIEYDGARNRHAMRQQSQGIRRTGMSRHSHYRLQRRVQRDSASMDGHDWPRMRGALRGSAEQVV